jgi:FkbM family methyltransferase
MRHYLDGLAAQPCVYYALVDLMQYGRDALDLGAWQGDMSIIMSRLSGPRGQIVAVEASRKYAEVCQRHLIENGCANVFLINRAIWSDSESEVSFFEDARWPQGGQIRNDYVPGDDPNTTLRSVRTVCVDDIVRDFAVRPYLIKADLEGGEREMIKGARETIGAHRPILILEQDPSHLDIAEYLARDHHYTAICLDSYEAIDDIAAFYKLGSPFNAAFFPVELCARSAYAKLVRKRCQELELHRDGDTISTQELSLDPGRYVMRAVEQDRAALRQMPFSMGFRASASNAAGDVFYSTSSHGKALALGHVFIVTAVTRASITLAASDDIGRNVARAVSGLVLERIEGSLPTPNARYNDLRFG